jgi:hypothetical protein
MPTLEVSAGDGSTMTIGHELAILSWIGRAVPSMGGESAADFAASSQLMCECEDIYAKLTRYQPTTRQPDKCSAAELAAFWSTSPDSTVHNRDQGLHVSLALLDRFAAACAAGDGQFTATGASVGECKLFSTLHALVLIEPDVLRPHPRLGAFYARFASRDATRTLLETGGQMPAPFEQYFVAGA